MTHEAFRKQADRNFFPGSTMPAPYTGRSASEPKGGAIVLTPEQQERLDAWKDAWGQGFKEGLAGAVKGDGFRGLARGALQEGADTLDFIQNAPIRAAYIPSMLGGKLITYTTGNDKLEQGVRKTRNFLNKLLTFGGHQITGGMRALAASKSLDPKYLSQDAYNQAVLAGKGGVIAADIAATGKLPTKALNVAAATQIPDALTQGAAAVESVVKDIKAAERRQAISNAAKEIWSKKYEKRLSKADPFTSTDPVERVLGAPKSLLEHIGFEEVKKDPETKEVIRQAEIQHHLDNLAFRDAVKKLTQGAAAGTAGVVGLTAAHQITKRIPALRKRRILRYLLNAAAAGGLGYAGWKLTQKV